MFFKHIVTKYKKPVLSVVRIVSIVCILYIIHRYLLQIIPFTDKRLLAFSFFWLIAVLGYKISPNLQFECAVFFYAAMIFFRLIGDTELSERSAVWFYLFIMYYIVLSLASRRIVLNTTIAELPERIKNDIFTIVHLVKLSHHTTTHIAIPIVKKGLRPLFYSIPLFKPIWLRIRKPLSEVAGQTASRISHYYVATPLWMKICIAILLLSSYLLYRNMQARFDLIKNLTPAIIATEPKLAYRSTKIIVRGKNFGDKSGNALLLSSVGVIQPDLWTSDKIIFTVPLHWKEGIIEYWVARRVNIDSKFAVFTSDKKQFKLLPTTEKFSVYDDMFFNELKNISKEAREINGYE